MNTQTALGKVTTKTSDLNKIRELEQAVVKVANAKTNGITKMTITHSGGIIELEPGSSSDAVADSATSILNGEITALKAAFNQNADEDLTLT